MFSLIITLLLINTYSGSFGNPIFTQSRNSIVKDLNLLATSCDNPFLASQITSNKECSSETVTNNEELFKCLMFYDINAQLCNSSKKLLINETDFQASMSASLDVKKVCSLAENWIISKLPKYAIYKTTIDKILSNPTKCYQMCEIDLLYEEANFFCKYFNWGTGILKRTEQELKPEIKKGLPLVGLASDKKVEEPLSSSIPSVTSISLPNKNDKKVPEVHEAVLKPVETPTDLSSTQSNSIKPEPIPSAGSTANKPVSGPQSLDINIKPHEESKNLPNPIDNKPSAVSEGLQKSGDIQDIDGTALQENNKLPVVNGNNVLDNPNLVLNKPALEELKPKPGKPDDDYQGSDEGLGDIQGGDDGEDAVGGEVEMKPKPALNTSVKKVESSVLYKGEVSQREFYANSIPDDFVEDDDHFFPLFLTGIVFVVLLYVLYHNKSKVTKVVLGLIVEGRQPGRRRNSRGHAYRRLDTLEQAISANSTAPPSKIIY